MLSLEELLHRLNELVSFCFTTTTRVEHCEEAKNFDIQISVHFGFDSLHQLRSRFDWDWLFILSMQGLLIWGLLNMVMKGLVFSLLLAILHVKATVMAALQSEIVAIMCALSCDLWMS